MQFKIIKPKSTNCDSRHSDYTQLSHLPHPEELWYTSVVVCFLALQPGCGFSPPPFPEVSWS